jgi:hypothetical protein
MQSDLHLPGLAQERKLNNVVCSGASTQDVLNEQFRDTNGSDLQYGTQPAFGKPQFATLTVGGDDIDFINLIRNCIIQLVPSWSCDDQLAASWKLINSTDLVDNIGIVIDMTVEKGQAVHHDDFRLFVTGYGQFFNADTDACDTVTWRVLPWSTPPIYLTKQLRSTLNEMSLALNAAVSKAVASRTQMGVIYVDWDADVNGHRYCEAGKNEPDPNNEDIWFYEWPGDPKANYADGTTLLSNLAKVIDPTGLYK